VTGSFARWFTCMRNGVVAILRDGRIVAINAEAVPHPWHRTRATDIGRNISDLLHGYPDLVRLFAGAFELNHLAQPRRDAAEIQGTVIGYTLSLVRDERGRTGGATLFFKDSRWSARGGEGAPARSARGARRDGGDIAHELKTALASIEVMAGLLRRQMGDRQDAQAMLGISSAKQDGQCDRAGRCWISSGPSGCQVDPTTSSRVVQDAISVADRKTDAPGDGVDAGFPADLPQLHAITSNCASDDQPAHQCREPRRAADGPYRGTGAPAPDDDQPATIC